MRGGSFLISVCFCLLVTATALAQTLSTDVYSSEDELYEALVSGELSWEEYRTLLELMLNGDTPRNPFLFDEIPNLIFIDTLTPGETTPLKVEQAAGFLSDVRGKGAHGRIRYRYVHLLEDEAKSGYRIDGDFNLAQHWKSSARLYRDRYGHEQVVARSVSYDNKGSALKSVTLGSYNTRLGLGTVFGHRGKLFDYSDELNGESWLFPDYGGFNGLKALVKTGATEVDLLGSVNRDADFRLTTFGGMISRQFSRWRGGLIIGQNRLTNRRNDSTTNDTKTALYLNHHSKGLMLAFEATSQLGEAGSSSALLFEGKRTLNDVTIKLAGWSYGDSFLNLTSGSKAASLSRSFRDSITGFDSRDRLAGQTGGLLETILRLENRWELTSALIYGRRSFDSTRTEIMGSLRRIWSRRFSLRVDFLNRRSKTGIGSDNRREDRRARLEASFNMGKTEARTYIAYQTPTRGSDYWAWFARVSTRFVRLGEFELWSNVGRITEDGIQYWYGYLRNVQPLTEKTALTLKLSHSFSENRTDRHETTFAIELEAGL